ncbi:4'-phosphopantetheinyl transferase family protein [uncultured Lutibacter sp.]|uniref:4'-phosphopantetheinyl transferase family protein n=1 Tax=uncultured Lutibacter sp. TaxID=437739 RepID=UPI00260C1350|nr:4'-phosphopantetheinyl transferase family protein [uncultured Lutibacter sp.]
MPLYKTINPNKHTAVYVWKIEASFDKLSEGIDLTERSKNRLASMKSEIHRRGFISIRHLLLEAGYTDFDLFYNGNGKPHLKDGKNISITHSFEYSAIIISNVEVGIDIEKNRDKIKIIQNKFVNFERWFISKEDDYIEQLTVIWGGKESLYKIYPHGGLTFKNDIDIESFKMAEGKTRGHIRTYDWDKFYDIHFELLNGFTLVYAIGNE